MEKWCLDLMLSSASQNSLIIALLVRRTALVSLINNGCTYIHSVTVVNTPYAFLKHRLDFYLTVLYGINYKLQLKGYYSTNSKSNIITHFYYETTLNIWTRCMYVWICTIPFFHDSVDLIKEFLWYNLRMSLILMFSFLQMSSLMSPIPETGSTPTIGAKRIQKPGTAKPLPG